MNQDDASGSLDAFQIWAKGAPKHPGDPYHPLIGQLIAVGAVAEAIGDRLLRSNRHLPPDSDPALLVRFA